MKLTAYSMQFARSAVIGSVVCVLAFASTAHAATLRGSETLTIPADEAIVGDVYSGGGTVNVLGAIKGDLVTGGGVITVQGAVEQSVLAVGGSVTLLGPVGHSIRAVGGNITVGGTVVGDVVVAGGTVHILQGTIVGGDVVAAGGDVIIDGTVGGNVTVRGGRLTINGPVGKAVDAHVQEFTLGSAAQVAGGIIYSAPKEVVRADGAHVTGPVAYTPTAPYEETQKADTAAARKNMAGAFLAFFGFMVFVKLVGLTVLSLILLWLFKPLATEVSKQAIAHPGISGVIGSATMVVSPIALVLICVTIVGMMAGIAGFLAYGLLLTIASAFAMIVLGAVIAHWSRSKEIVNWKWTLLGALVFTVLSFVPIIGWAVACVIYFIALGALVRVWYEKYQK